MPSWGPVPSEWHFSGSKTSTIATVLLLTYSQFSHVTELSHKDIQFVYTATGAFQNRLFSLHICDMQDRMKDCAWFRNYNTHNWSRIDGEKWYRGIMWWVRDCVQVYVLCVCVCVCFLCVCICVCMCFVCVLWSHERVSTLERALTSFCLCIQLGVSLIYVANEVYLWSLICTASCAMGKETFCYTSHIRCSFA